MNKLRGVFRWKLNDGMEKWTPNTITDEGFLEFASRIFSEIVDQDIPVWFMGLISDVDFVAVDQTDTTATHDWVEQEDYDEGSRQPFAKNVGTILPVVPTMNIVPCVFTCLVPFSVKGFFICLGDDTKGGSGGILWSVAEESPRIDLVVDDVLTVSYFLIHDEAPP